MTVVMVLMTVVMVLVPLLLTELFRLEPWVQLWSIFLFHVVIAYFQVIKFHVI